MSLTPEELAEELFTKPAGSLGIVNLLVGSHQVDNEYLFQVLINIVNDGCKLLGYDTANLSSAELDDINSRIRWVGYMCHVEERDEYTDIYYARFPRANSDTFTLNRFHPYALIPKMRSLPESYKLLLMDKTYLSNIHAITEHNGKTVVFYFSMTHL